MKELSVLLPVFECSCVTLVQALHEQCTAAHITFEIIVADDGSSTPETIENNRQIEQLPYVRYIVRQENVGRAAIRNFLVSQSQYARLLFCDGDMELQNEHFIETYLNTEGSIVYGGYVLSSLNPQPSPLNLRYRYEQAHRLNHSAEQRATHPYHDFHTSNFLVDRSILIDHPFDERFRYYGYEDVLWGKTLREHHIDIVHIDNPLSFCHYEDNEHFISKTEEGLRTLADFQDELEGFSSLLTTTQRISRLHLTKPLTLLYRLTGKTIRNRLIHNKMPLFVFNIYRLLYFVHIIQKKK